MIQQAYLFALGVACVLGVGIAYRAWLNRETKEAPPLLGVAAATVIWASGTMGLILSSSVTADYYWTCYMYVGIVGAPITFFVLALEYTGNQEYVTPWTVGGLVALGGIFLGLAWTNSFHHLYWAEVDRTAAVPSGATTSPAIGFWGFVVFTYTLLAVGSVLFVRYVLTAPDLYRSQTLAILGAIAAPWAANIPYSLQFMAADYTPVALAVTTVALWAAIFRYRLTDVGPIALRTVFESINSGVVVLDRAERVVDLNAKGKDFLDASDDAIGRNVRDLPGSDAFGNALHNLEEGRQVVPVERDGSANSESERVSYYEIQVAPIERRSGRGAGRILVIDDVSSRERQQRRLERQNARLEEFTSVVSHDLRNPLNVASGNVTLAREEYGSEFLDNAERALTRMEILIDDLLALARGGRRITELEPVALEKVVSDAWDTVDTKQATLVNHADVQILADRSRLHQLIENLVRNAVEHGGEGVTVTVEAWDEGFSVSDDGQGIPPGDREDIFEAGYSTNEDGTGFGLNIVNEIAEAHGWTVRVADGSPSGARFHIDAVESVK